LLKQKSDTEINEYRIKFIDEQKKSDKFATRLDEMQKQIYMQQATIDILTKQIDELKQK